jgi:hypothetical protein
MIKGSFKQLSLDLNTEIIEVLNKNNVPSVVIGNTLEAVDPIIYKFYSQCLLREENLIKRIKELENFIDEFNDFE